MDTPKQQLLAKAGSTSTAKGSIWNSVRESSYQSSQYWLKDTIFNQPESFFGKQQSISDDVLDYIQLAQYQRAISNFIRILTGRNDIRVVYNQRGESYTDGTVVVISAGINRKDFDVAVGLALHEASHLIYTDFKKTKRSVDSIDSEYRSQFKDIWNVIEDLFIDAMTYKLAPGYRGYYAALNQKYFDGDELVQGMWSSEYTVPSMENYMFHIINIRNPKRNLKALPGLEDIFKLIDLQNITRLQTPEQRISLASDILSIVRKSLENKESSEFQSNAPLSKSVETQIRSMYNQQKLFTGGEIKKKAVSKVEASLIEGFATVDIDTKIVGHNSEFDVLHSGVPVQIIRDINRRFIESGAGFAYGLYSHSHQGTVNTRGIKEAVRNGKILAKKLQIRNEERVTKTARLNSGKLDRRLLHELGFDNFDVFSKINISTYRNAYIHISVDQSASMSQSGRFRESLKFAATMAAASKFLPNVHLQVSVRSTFSTRGSTRSQRSSGSKSGELPYIMYVFDSKKHNLKDIEYIFPRLSTAYLTPEGLCFDAIMDDVVLKSRNSDSYFINLCDGEPNMRYITPSTTFEYNHNISYQHSAQQMKRMERYGIRFMAFFIGDRSSYRNVYRCYGKNTTYLHSSSNIAEITKIMNTQLLIK
jgi:hypothetical protein